MASAGQGQIAVRNLFPYYSRMVKKGDKKGVAEWNKIVDMMYDLDISDVPKMLTDEHVQKFDPDQARDDHGRWTGDGGNGVTNTPEFKAWFGNSKAVDKDGKPLRLYHGTHADFSQFKADKQGQIWLTSDPNYANIYSAGHNGANIPADGGNVMPVYLRAENPYSIRSEDWPNAPRVETLRARGYDSVKLNNSNYSATIWIALNGSTQIKSAVGNQGTFDPTNPDITKSVVQKYNENHDSKTGEFTTADNVDMLEYHGTDENYVKSILKEGFRPSEDGAYGKGIYLTDVRDAAQPYGESILEMSLKPGLKIKNFDSPTEFNQFVEDVQGAVNKKWQEIKLHKSLNDAFVEVMKDLGYVGHRIYMGFHNGSHYYVMYDKDSLQHVHAITKTEKTEGIKLYAAKVPKKQSVAKDAADASTTAGDQSLVGAGYTWHRLPSQKPMDGAPRKSPRLITGPIYAPRNNNASYPNAPINVGKSWDKFDADRKADAHEHPSWIKENNPNNLTVHGTRVIPKASSGKRYETSILYSRNDLEDENGNSKDTIQNLNSLHDSQALAEKSLPAVGSKVGSGKVIATRVFYHGPKKSVEKDDTGSGDEATDSPDNNGRPRWMASPGQGGKDPQYRSQKPGPNGNQDELFSENINENPPTMIPVDPDGYYIW
jgi:hypothetical protein